VAGKAHHAVKAAGKGEGMFVVLGASGYVGRATVKHLRQSNKPVRAVLRSPSIVEEMKALGCDVAMADLRNERELRAALSGAHAVQILLPLEAKCVEPNYLTEMMDCLASSVRHERPDHVLALSDYGAHLTGDAGIASVFRSFEARLSNLPSALTILRTCEHIQNWLPMIRLAHATGRLPSFHSPVTHPIPVVDAEDVGAIAAALLPCPPAAKAIVHVEGPQRHGTEEIASTLGDLLYSHITAVALDKATWHSTLSARTTAFYAGLLCGMFDAHNRGLIDVDPANPQVLRGTTPLSASLANLLRSDSN
jgi:uncharacterized protein YbjT (DUF2867 family)